MLLGCKMANFHFIFISIISQLVSHPLAHSSVIYFELLLAALPSSSVFLSGRHIFYHF